METSIDTPLADEAGVVRALAALAQPQRLRAFRALVVAGPEGLTPGECCPDEDEFLSVRRIPFQELVQRCLSGEIQDGKTVTAVLKAKLLLGL